MLTLAFSEEAGAARVDAHRASLLSHSHAPGMRPNLDELLPSYTLPFSPTSRMSEVIGLVAADVSEYFRKAGFDVNLMSHESTWSRTHKRHLTAFTSVDISWLGLASENSETREVAMTQGSISTPTQELSYQTAPLTEYDPMFQLRAAKLFKDIQDQIGTRKTKAYKGSYSVFGRIGAQTVIKIIIYQAQLGKINGHPVALADGIYILIRANGSVGERIWKQRLDLLKKIDRAKTIGIAPSHSERFAYFRISENHDRESLIDFVQSCAEA